MKIILYQHSPRRVAANLCSLAVCLITLSSAPFVNGAPADDPALIQEGHPTAHVHDHGGKTWPPTPDDIANVREFSTPAAKLVLLNAKQRQEAETEKPIKARSDIRRALGNRFNKATVIEDDSKDGSDQGTRLVYFSHANNSTVEVTTKGEKSQKVKRVKKIRARDYQPEITDEEIAAAEKIARTYYAAKGETRVEALKGFGILAYQPESGRFYDTRVLYISFHPDSDSPPEFMAWVDLTKQAVIRTREEQQ